MYCNTLQLTATHCNSLQHLTPKTQSWSPQREPYTNTLHHTAPHCTTLQHLTPKSQPRNLNLIPQPQSPKREPYTNKLYNIATHGNALQNIATHCNTLPQQRSIPNVNPTPTHCMTLQHTATRCHSNAQPRTWTLHQHTATHYHSNSQLRTWTLHQHTATRCNRNPKPQTPQHELYILCKYGNTLQQHTPCDSTPHLTATQGNTLHHRVTHCISTPCVTLYYTTSQLHSKFELRKIVTALPYPWVERRLHHTCLSIQWDRMKYTCLSHFARHSASQSLCLWTSTLCTLKVDNMRHSERPSWSRTTKSLQGRVQKRMFLVWLVVSELSFEQPLALSQTAKPKAE